MLSPLNEARHGDVELNEIKEVRGIPNGLDVLINPLRNVRRAVLFTTKACHCAASIGRPNFCKVRPKNGPNSFVILSKFIKRSARHTIDPIVEILDRHQVTQYSARSLKCLWSKPVFLCERVNTESWL
jgi:hypothetical protein